MADTVIDTMLSNDALDALIHAQYDLACDYVRENPTSVRPPILVVIVASAAPGKDGDLYLHWFDQGLGDPQDTLYHAGESFGQRHLVVTAAILTLQTHGLRVTSEELQAIQKGKHIGPDRLQEGIVVGGLAADGRCMMRAATITRDGDEVDFEPVKIPDSEAGTDNILTAFFEGYEAGLAEGLEGQRTN